MEFVQFHPTSLFAPACPGYGANGAGALAGRSFLITEAVRGEGGMLFNLGEWGLLKQRVVSSVGLAGCRLAC